MKIIVRIGAFVGFFLLISYACSTSAKIRDGRTAHQQKQYARAITMFLDELEGIHPESEEYADISYLLGESYHFINDSQNSLKWYIEAAKRNHSPQAFWDMAYALKKNGRYEDAILSFQRLMRLTTGRENDLRLEIEKCNQAIRLQSQMAESNIEILPMAFNSGGDDFAPFLTADDHLIFTSDRTSSEEYETYHWTGRRYYDLYKIDLKSEAIDVLPMTINSDYNDGVITMSRDGQALYFTRCGADSEGYCRIMVSKFDEGTWRESRLAFSQKSTVNYSDPVLVENDSVLIFSSNDPVGIGANDLWYVVLEADGQWSEPDLMPPYLNTIGEERFPTWHNGTLYYSSDFMPGLGGLDIFKTELKDDGSWSKPINIGHPVNTNEDDYYYSVVSEHLLESDVKRQAYFTSTRGVFGSDDIYRLTEYRSEEEKIEKPSSESDTTVVTVLEPPKSFFLRVWVKENVYAIPENPNSYIVGQAPVPNASIKVIAEHREDIFQTHEDGGILLPIDTGTVYRFKVGKIGYLRNAVTYNIVEDFDELDDGHVFDLNITIDKAYQGIEIVMDDIYYDFNESYIRDDARTALDKLINLLNENEEVRIQLNSHTDCQGEEDYNLNLSQERAEAAIDYLIEHGNIDANRLIAKGFGESSLEIDCECTTCSEEEHQINRRTTFMIIEKE